MITALSACSMNEDSVAQVSTFLGTAGVAWTTANGDTDPLFDRPQALLLDDTGQLLVSDHRRIRRVIIRAMPGGPSIGTVQRFVPGPNSEPAARVSQWIGGGVQGMALDPRNGNIVISDTAWSRVVVFTRDGEYVTHYGATSGVFRDEEDMHVDGPGNLAIFYGPAGVTVDQSGNIFVAEMWNNRIRKIDTNGYVSTFAGSIKDYREGRGPNAYFQGPVGLTMDNQGNLIVADTWNMVIRYITPKGDTGIYASFKDSWGFRDGESQIARIRLPQHLFFDKNTENLYFSDSDIHAVRVVNRGRKMPFPLSTEENPLDWTIIGNKTTEQPCSTRCMNRQNRLPECCILDTEWYYCRDPECFCPHQPFVIMGRHIQTIAGHRGIPERPFFIGRGHRDGPWDLAQFNSPRGIVVTDRDVMYVADFDNHVIRRIDR